MGLVTLTFDLWLLTFDLETGMRVALKVGNLSSKFVHARLLGSRIIRYVRDGQAVRQTDGQTKATLIAPFPTGRGITRQQLCYRSFYETLQSADEVKLAAIAYSSMYESIPDCIFNRYGPIIMPVSTSSHWASGLCKFVYSIHSRVEILTVLTFYVLSRCIFSERYSTLRCWDRFLADR